MTSVVCRRCGEEKPGLERAPLPGVLGNELLATVCTDCWNEWRLQEVRVINELRLNFIEPAAQRTLERHLREFLQLPPEAT